MRILCHLFGCREGKQPYLCVRCGADAYNRKGPPFIMPGLLGPLVALWRAGRRVLWPWRRCAECGRPYFRLPLSFEYEWCSKKCHDEWLPF